MINPVFHPFYSVDSLAEKESLSSKYIPLIEENYKKAPNNAWDWNVHTSYAEDHNLVNRIDWNEFTTIYDPYIRRFIKEYFNQDLNYNISGTPWYTVYGRGQNANTHEHLPDHFAVVHFLKFNPQIHWPISFVNPNGAATKYFLELNPNFKSKIDFNNSSQSFYHPRFSPSIQEGDLLIFPGQLEHLVEKNHSDEIRITIALNIKVF